MILLCIYHSEEMKTEQFTEMDDGSDSDDEMEGEMR